MIKDKEKTDTGSGQTDNKSTKHSANGITSEEIEETLGIDREGQASTRKKIIYGVSLLVILAAAFWIWKLQAGSDAPNYFTEEVIQDDLILEVSATGNLETVNTVEVGSEISGLINEVYVDYNDQVTSGQLLAKLDTDRLEAEVAQAQAALQASEASLMQALASLDEQRNKTRRAEELARQSLISTEEIETARATLSRAEAGVASARAQTVVNRAAFDMAETNLEKASIRSPIDGVVLSSNIKPGQAVAASFQTPVLFTLAEDLTNMELHVDVDEADIGQIEEGQQATFTVDAYRDTVFSADIIKVYYAPQADAEVVTYEAVLSVDNSGMLLRPGMTATTSIVTNRVEDALLVPNSALRFTPPGESREAQDGPVVWTLKEGKPAGVSVRTGLAGARYTQILSGELKPGMKLLINIRQ